MNKKIILAVALTSIVSGCGADPSKLSARERYDQDNSCRKFHLNELVYYSNDYANEIGIVSFIEHPNEKGRVFIKLRGFTIDIAVDCRDIRHVLGTNSSRPK